MNKTNHPITHGHTVGRKKTRTFQCWSGMLRRCRNPKNKDYKNYGGRGIKVCERWNDFKNFLTDMGEKPEGVTIERKDNSGNYEPSNCKWIPKSQQSENRRGNTMLTHNGKTMSMAQWERELGFGKHAITSRRRRGWTGERLFSPLKH